jgi:hypothetical protein
MVLATGLQRRTVQPRFSLQEIAMLRVRTMVLLAAMAAASGALAQMYSPGYGTYGAPMSNYLASSYLVQQVANGTRDAGSRKAPRAVTVAADAAELRFSPARPIAPRVLAQSYPEASRARAEQFFAQTLTGYHGIEAKFGLRKYDLAGAVATFVAGNYIAYRDEPFPDEHFKPLVQQMRGAIGGMAALRGASDADKQELYEQLAILGTYMALTREGLQQRPDPQLAASMKRAAKQYLEQFLKVDPARMSIGAQGLTLR